MDLPWYDPNPVVGEPIEYNFSIQVADAFNNPLPNKTVIANISPFPQLLAIFPNYGMLEKNVAVSDEDGIVRFNEITITLINVNAFSLQFYCEGVYLSPSFSSLGMRIVTNVAKVIVTTPPPHNVTEGEMFAKPSIISVLDSSGNPISNKNVMAMVTTAAGLSANPKILAYSKVLQYVVAPPTDASGKTEFTNLTFSLGGFAGMYGITFYCDGVASEEAIVYVDTLVNSVIWNSAAPESLTMGMDGFISVMIITAKVLDALNNPIKNKVLFLKQVQDWGNFTIEVALTDDQGTATFVVYTLPYVQARPNTNNATLVLIAETDGVSSQPVSINVTLSPYNPDDSGTLEVYIQVLNPPNGSYSITSPTSGFQPLVRLVDYRGDPIPYANISIRLMPTPTWSVAPYLLSPVSTSYEVAGAGTTDEDGYLQFGSPGSIPFGVLRGYAGTIFIGFVANWTYFCSDLYFVHVDTPIVSVMLSHPSKSHFYNMNNYVVYPYMPLNLSVTVTCFKSCEKMPPTFPFITILEGPVVNAGIYFESTVSLFEGLGDNEILPEFGFWNGYQSDTYCSFNSSNLGECTFGSMTAIGLSGGFTIMAEVAGILSNPINITMGYDINSIAVVENSVSEAAAIIQRNFFQVPQVRLLDLDNNPMAGYYAYVGVCGNPDYVYVIRNPNNTNCFDCFFSSVSDENGIVEFANLTFFSGDSGTYDLCFYTGILDPVPWNVSIHLYNPIWEVQPLGTQDVVTPGQNNFFTGVHAYSSYDFSMLVNIVQVSGPAPLVLVPVENIPCATSIDCTLNYNVQGPDGLYTLAYFASGVASNVNVTIALDSAPSRIFWSFGDNNASAIQVDLFTAFPVQISAMTASNVLVVNSNFTIAISSQPTGSQKAQLSAYTCTSAPSQSDCEYNLMFTAGMSGTYEIIFTSGPAVSSPLQVNLTNPIQKIEVTNAQLINSATTMVAMPVQPKITVVFNTPTNLAGQPVQAILQGVKGYGNGLYDGGTPILDENGEAQFSNLTLIVQVPGTYMLQFIVAGVPSDPIPVHLQNPAFPSYSHLSLHHTQTKLVLAVLLVIPLYIGNSIRQPAWQLIISVPSLAAIGYIAYSYLFPEIKDKSKLIAMGLSYYLLDTSMRGILIITVVAFFTVVIMVIHGMLRKSYTSHYDEKVLSCRPYIRHELLSYGMQRYIEIQQEKDNPKVPIVTYSKPSLFIRLKNLILKKKIVEPNGLVIQDYEPVSVKPESSAKKRKPYTAFFFPMRLFLACGASTTCALLVACLCVFLINAALRTIDAKKSQIDSILQLAIQLQELTVVGAGGDFWTPLKIETVAALLSVSPEQLANILAYIQQGSVISENYMNEVEELLVRFRRIFHLSASISLGFTSAIILATWIFVFRKYKQRIFYLRKGRLDLITRNGDKFSIRGAANYVGLQSVHTAAGFFVIWIILTLSFITFQIKEFWLWIWSYFPILVAFLLGLPFISKTITKFIISHWVLKNETILHLRLWLIFDFMWIFVNLLSSIVMSVIRFGFAIGTAIIYAIRMDAPLLREENDHMDYGFKAYMGMLLMDHKHNNPILIQFTTILIDEMKKERKKRKKNVLKYAKEKWKNDKETLIPIVGESIDFYGVPDTKTRSRIIHRWWLLITLHNNPQLQALRKHALSEYSQL
eukprot:Phypoly_transcript_00348.p1 GENE.Phypoly_transcript_00348~~Phypoly_transcript_00348.p1  ORF type:complete len:1697 (+),score=190.35 Phypoly_transcript_00348:144-5093(+)